MAVHKMNTPATFPLNEDHPAIRHSTYAIIQPGQIDPAYRQGLILHAIVPEPFNAQSDLFPALIDLKALDVEQRASLFEHATAWESGVDTPYFSALLVTSASTAQIVAHLARRILVKRPDGGQDALRFYDPFVFRHLRWLLTPAQMDSLLGPAQSWHWRAPSGEWIGQNRVAPHASVPPLLLKPDQWPTLTRLVDINLTLRQLARVAPNIKDDEMLARQLDKLLDEAWVKHGMASTPDRCLYAEQAVRFLPGIHTHPQLRHRLEQVRTGAMSYVRACADLNATVLHELSAQLETSNIVSPP
jgi:Domain of unknown function (DUF4123)